MSGANDAPTTHQTSSPVDGNGDEACQNDLVDAFNKIDVNGDGSITKEELWCHMSKQGKDLGISKKNVDILFGRIDKNGDGAIDVNEYSSFMEEVKSGCGNGQNRISSSLKYSTLRESLMSCDQPAEELTEELTEEPKGAPRPRKSSLKCATLRESLLSCERPKEEPTKARRKSSIIGRLSLVRSAKEEPTKARSNSQKRRKLLTRKRRTNLFRFSSTTAAREKEDDNAAGTGGPLHRSASVIRFFDVEVRDYVVTVSDNPCCRSGVALELGWEYVVRERQHLDTFEDKRSTERAKNFQKEKRLTLVERQKILRQLGASTKEIQQATKRANIIRNSRQKSIAMNKRGQDKAQEQAEKRWRRLRSFFWRKSKKGDVAGVCASDVERSNRTLMLLMGLDGTAEDVSHQ